MIRLTKERCTLEVASLHNLYIFLHYNQKARQNHNYTKDALMIKAFSG